MLQKYIIVLLPVLAFSCAGKKTVLPVSELAGTVDNSGTAGLTYNQAELPAALEELAELERSGEFIPGLGLAESNLREKAADYAGAVLAVYKELSWAYALGVGDVSAVSIQEGLGRLLESGTASLVPPGGRIETANAVKAILAFTEGRWAEAETQITSLYGSEAEADSFSRWMLLVCAMEKSAGTEGRSAYGAIRARYVSFPEYWYRGARAAAAAAGNSMAGEYAERCINLAPEGPYAAECRIILARSMGLPAGDAPFLRTRLEIEAAVSGAAKGGNPELLLPLLPLAGLPDNPSTLYASGAMRALAGNSAFRNWFVKEAGKATGRLAERLLYISRG
ncbi:hypothetical protein AGMMS50230_21870 [Spirochaetia bacterium]|nr:hypothetical protein AGMMS50230_21870 [Spirochaetia bacterium]